MIPAAQLAAGILSTSAAAWLRQISTLVLYAVAARMLDPDQIGIFALASAILLLAEYGIFDAVSEAVVQRGELEPGHIGAALFVAAMAVAVIMIAVIGFSGWIAAVFGAAALAGILPWMAGSVCLMHLSAAHAGLLRRQARFHTLSALAAIAAMIACGTGAVLLMLGWGVRSLVAYFVIEKLVLAAGQVGSAIGHPVSRFSLRQLSDIVSYGSPICGQRVVFYLRSQMDRILIGWLLGPTVLGIYQLAARISDSLWAILLSPTSKLLFVNFARLQGRPALLRKVFRDSLEAIAFAVFPASLGLSLVGPELVRILFGENWGLSETLLQVLALGGIPLSVSVMSGAVVSAFGRPHTFLLVETGTALIGLLLLLALAPLGVWWIAAAFVIRETASVILYAFILRAHLQIGMRSYFGAVAHCLAMAGIMAIGVVLLQALVLPKLPDMLLLATVTAFGAASYGLLMLATRRPQIIQMIFLVRQGLFRSLDA